MRIELDFYTQGEETNTLIFDTSNPAMLINTNLQVALPDNQSKIIEGLLRIRERDGKEYILTAISSERLLKQLETTGHLVRKQK